MQHPPSQGSSGQLIADDEVMRGRQSHAPRLKAGEQLTRDEFERRCAAYPDIKKAELVNGIVRMPPPVRYDVHGKPHAAIFAPILVYAAHTPGVGVADNTTVRLDADNEPQPDVMLRIESPALRQSVVDADGYIQGAPELVAEVSATSASCDLGDKLRVYRRHGVREYIVWRTRERRLDWFQLVGDAYQPLSADAENVIRSRAFPGLRIAATALLDGDLAAVMAKAHEGIGSPEHREFVAGLDG